MSEFFFSLDKSVFYFINTTLSNPLCDAVMPFLTDLNKQPIAIIVAIGLWLLLMIRGGRRGRTAGILLVVAVALSDQISSSLLKNWIERLRPCHVLIGIRELVPCGPGYSFPSSHAVTNFAGATILFRYYRRYAVWWYSIASFVAFTRPYVGVHYPSDALGGAAIGMACSFGILYAWSFAEKKILDTGKKDP